jgi:hypothetical protein
MTQGEYKQQQKLLLLETFAAVACGEVRFGERGRFSAFALLFSASFTHCGHRERVC